MALSSALFSGISGLSALGNAMQILGDNIANVNTVGFKGSTFNFQDLLSQSISTMSGTAQVGRGTGLGDVTAVFEQGSFESTGNTTDLAIGGDGFFILKESGAESASYSRAGNFRFDKDGYLVNPEGYVVQGWVLDEDGDDTGSPDDIVLSTYTSPPMASDQMQVIVNLDADGTDRSTGSDDALAKAWDGTDSPPLSDSAYEYQLTIKVYDSLGSAHDLTFYFDKANTASAYEFIITCAVGEDKRSIFAATNEAKGMLARGLLEFSSSTGLISDIDMWQFTGTGSGGDGKTLSSAANWTEQLEASNLVDGYFTFKPTFISGNSMTIKVDFGSHYSGTAWANDTLTTTQYSTDANSTIQSAKFQSANGYGAGDLQGVSVDVDGVITGTYSNGQLVPLYRVALAKFWNSQGLSKEGSNLFKETRSSGDAIPNRPGTNGVGSISPNSLEQSNVDIADELIKMIITQRGYQANSKIITVTDQMLQELMNLKR